MFESLSPIDTISFLTLLTLAIFGLFELAGSLKHRWYLNKRHLVILLVDPSIVAGKIKDFVKSIKPPFTFEIAIHHLGKDINYYVVLPRKRAFELTTHRGINEVGDYNLFHHGGEHLGAYLKGESDAWLDIDLEKIDFSRVNEIGEGVVVQIVLGKKRGKRASVNLRLLISAPSSYQAKEILAAIKPSFSGFNLIESRGDDFINKVNFREFNEKEAISSSTT